LVFEFDGFTLGIVGFTSTFPQEAWAKKHKPGVNYSDFNTLAETVAREKKKVDILVVSFHGGTERADDENDIQKAFAHVAVDAGADLILGHHPHVIQPLEVYKDKPILYSLGNFLFVSPDPKTKYTVVARAAITKEGVKRIDFTPVDTDGGRPFPVGGEGEAYVRAALDRKGALTQFPDRFRVAPQGEAR
jgi:poly-gamma-glutamate synthesis protein (capsule biosynthesis protein)